MVEEQMEGALLHAAAGGGVEGREGVAAGRPPLIDAAERGNLAELGALLATGADTEVLDEDGDTAFLCTCDAGQLECAQALAAVGCDTAAMSGVDTTGLLFAAREGHAALVAWLLGEGGAAGMLEARDEYGDTAFLVACNHRDLECAQVTWSA
jgi:ankyrin repeat protein